MTCFCADGWVCEQHPELPYPHARLTTDNPLGGHCAGPGMPCRNGCNELAPKTDEPRTLHAP